ncbi:unknown [Sutterella sp. CAG:351]|nr:unknown [Sutterella sp. CAG:351]
MHADVVVDDELETGKTNTLRRDLLELESELRIADVHHDLHGDLGESALLHFFHVEVKLALVDVARIAFGAGHRHFLILSEEFGRVAAANHSRNTELTGNNSRVAGTAAAVRHDGGGTAHHGFPVGVRHIGHEHVTRLHAIHFLCGQNDADGARSDLLTNGTAGHKSLGTLAVDRELFLDVSLVLAALNRFRTGLQNVDLAVDTVLAPLDIHRAAVVLFNQAAELSEFNHVLVSQSELVAFFFRRINRADGFLGTGFSVELHLDQLGAQLLTDDRELALFEDGLMNVVLIRVHSALHHGFAEAVGSGDEDHLVKTGFCVEREHHAGSALIGAAHTLNTGGKRHFSVIEALQNTIGNSAVVVERSEYFLHAGENLIDSVHIEVGFLLTGERGVRKILGSSRRTDSHRDLGAVTQPVVILTDFLLEFSRERGFLDPLTDLGARLGELVHIFNVETFESLVNTLIQVALLQEEPESISSRCESVRNTDSRTRQLGEQFTKRGVLAAHPVNIGISEFAKRNNVLALHAISSLPPMWGMFRIDRILNNSSECGGRLRQSPPKVFYYG